MKLRFDHPAWRRLAPLLGRGLVRAFLGATRSSLHGDQEGKALLQSEAPVVFALWHGHLLGCLYLGTIFCRLKPPIVIMASPSRDGELISEVARGLGYLICPGSRRKGGFQALRRLADYLRQGHTAALTADGSRGPLHVVQKGVLYLARETAVPILPIAAASSRKITLNTWDRFEVTLPLGQSVFLVDAPLRLDPQVRGEALEKQRQNLEARLNHLFRCSQNFFRKP
jgi:lysophospholipid acyltransferase (LPLAT)-like uncharacterized protein